MPPSASSRDTSPSSRRRSARGPKASRKRPRRWRRAGRARPAPSRGWRGPRSCLPGARRPVRGAARRPGVMHVREIDAGAGDGSRSADAVVCASPGAVGGPVRRRDGHLRRAGAFAQCRRAAAGAAGGRLRGRPRRPAERLEGAARLSRRRGSASSPREAIRRLAADPALRASSRTSTTAAQLGVDETAIAPAIEAAPSAATRMLGTAAGSDTRSRRSNSTSAARAPPRSPPM